MTTSANAVTIREFRPGDESAFQSLNEEWILRYFGPLEPPDIATLTDPHGKILAHGGRIFFAAQGDELIGCCGLIALAPGEFELAKMTVKESFRGSGIGRRLLETVISEARALGAHRLYLETNGKLQPAVRLYESVGFRHLPAERIVPSAYSRANVYMELSL
jgi:GNAT superfamily N-acetyltransferase